MAEHCPEPDSRCKYAGTKQCILTRHHNYYPASDYRTPLERVFRALEENIEMLPHCEHEELHASQFPPLKPSREVMIHTLGEGMLYLSVSKKKEIYGNR